MEITEQEISQRYAEKFGHCKRKIYYHTNMKLLAFHVLTT